MKKGKILIFLFIIVFLLTSCQSPIEKANEALENGELEKAKKLYIELLKEEKEEPTLDAYYGLSQIYREEMALDLEKDILSKGLEKYPNSEKLKLRQASYYQLVGKPKEGIDILKELLEKEFNENILSQLIEMKIDNYYTEGLKTLYEKYRGEINNLKDLDLIYKSLKNTSENTSLISELEEKIKIAEKEEDNGSYIQGYRYIENNLDEELKIEDLIKGKFIDKNRDDIAIAYNLGSDLVIEIVNGKTGELILKHEIKEIYAEAAKLDYLEVEKELDKISLLYSVGASSTMPSLFIIYEVDENLETLKEIEVNKHGDTEIKLKDDFNIEITSENLDKKHTIPIPKEDRLGFIKDEQYTEDGKPIDEDLVRLYQDDYRVTRKNRRKNLIEIIRGFGGSYEFSGDRTGYIREYYEYKDGSYQLIYFDIEKQNKTEIVEEIDKEVIDDPDIEIDESLYTEYLEEYDFTLKFKNLGVEIDFYDDINSIKEVLGQGESEILEEEESAKYISYNIPGLEIIYLDVIKEDGKNERYNQMIIITEKGISTLRGLEVGMDLEDLTKIYKLDNILEENEEEIIYMIVEDYGKEFPRYIDLFIAVDKATGKVTRYNYATGL